MQQQNLVKNWQKRNIVMKMNSGAIPSLFKSQSVEAIHYTSQNTINRWEIGQWLRRTNTFHVMPITDRRGQQAAGIYHTFPTHQAVYTLEQYVHGKWACCGDGHTRASHAKHTDDIRVYWASSDEIAPGAIPAAWRLLTTWNCPSVYTSTRMCWSLVIAWRLVLAAHLLPMSVCNRH